jgi:hypothetical protein
MLRCKCGGHPRLENSTDDGQGFTEYYRCTECGREGTLTVTAGVEQLHGCLEVSTA